jgi:hypothetical protein
MLYKFNFCGKMLYISKSTESEDFNMKMRNLMTELMATNVSSFFRPNYNPQFNGLTNGLQVGFKETYPNEPDQSIPALLSGIPRSELLRVVN